MGIEIKLKVQTKRHGYVRIYHHAGHGTWFHVTDFLKCLGYKGGMATKIVGYNDRTMATQLTSLLTGHNSWYFSADILGGVSLSGSDKLTNESELLDRISFQIADFVTACNWENCKTGDAFNGEPPFKKLGESDMPGKKKEGRRKASEINPKEKPKEEKSLLKQAASEAVQDFVDCLKDVDEKLETLTTMLSQFVEFQNQQTRNTHTLLHGLLRTADKPIEDNTNMCEQLSRIERVVESLNDYGANRNQDSVSTEVLLEVIKVVNK